MWKNSEIIYCSRLLHSHDWLEVSGLGKIQLVYLEDFFGGIGAVG